MNERRPSDLPLSRRNFVAGCTGGVVSAAFGSTTRADGVATIAPADTLADYVATQDASTALESLGGGEAVYVPGHGATVDAAFVRRQRDWIRNRY